MVDDARRIQDLIQVVKRARSEAQKVWLRLLATSLIPLSNAHIDLKARHAALMKIAENGEAELERLRGTQF
jgi:hypothetical protein